MSELIRGSGGGKGGGGGGGISEQKDTLSSVAFARVVDLIGEGEIVGLVNGEQSIYLDNVPLMNTDGTYNFKNFIWESRAGSQSQLPLNLAPGIEQENSVNTKVTHSNGIKWMLIADSEADQIRLTLSVNALTTTTSSGKITGGEVQYKIHYARNNSDKDYYDHDPVYTDSIKGKTRSKYQRSVLLNLRQFGWVPMYVGVERVTEDSTSSLVQNDFYWDSFTLINTEKLSYANSALVGVKVDARQFSNIPARSYHVKGLYVRVPENYDPESRTYAGVWNGQWKLAYSNNPAWCFYDLLTNERYGLGKRVKPEMIDKWALYEIAKYCDEMVPTGLQVDELGEYSSGGYDISGKPTCPVPVYQGPLEPRFTLNCVINTRDDAYKVINNISSVFRGMTYWRSGSIAFMQDRPGAVEAIFSAANVIDGMFNYEGSSRSARHTVCLVAWNDPSDNYKQKYEYVEDRDGLERYGYRQTEIVAFGCTSQSQARRAGLWTLYTEQMETSVISFRASLDSVFLQPGSIIQISDPFRAGKRMGGRLLSSDAYSITLDSPVTIEAGTHHLTVIGEDGVPVERELNLTAGTYSTLNVNLALPVIVPGSMWLLSSPSLKPMLARVVSLKEVERHLFEISAVEHNPGKFNYIERGEKLERPSYSAISTTVPQVQNLVVTESTFKEKPDSLPSTVVTVSWDTSGDPTVRGYVVSVTRDGYKQDYPEQADTVIDIRNLLQGPVTISVKGISVSGAVGTAATIDYMVVGIDTTPPADVTNLTCTLNADKRNVLKWDDVADFIDYYEVRVGAYTQRPDESTTDASWDAAVFLTKVKSTEYEVAPMSVGTHTLQVKAVDVGGNYSYHAAHVDVVTAALPTPSGVYVHANVGSFGVQVDIPDHPLYNGIDVYISTTSGFTPAAANRVYHGTNNQATVYALPSGAALPVGTPIYVKVAYYSDILTDTPPMSSQVPVTLLAYEANLLVLTSSSQVFQVKSDGSNNPSSVTLTAVLSGQLTGSVTWSATGSATLTGTGNSRTLTYANMGSNETVTVTASLVKDGVTYSDSTTVAKIREGLPGSNAKAVSVSSTAQTFVVAKNTGTVSPSSITVTATPVNFSSPTYAWYVDGTLQSGQTASSFSVSSFSTGTKTIKCVVSGDSTTAFDQVTLYSVAEGNDSLVAYLTNEAHTIACDSSGNPKTGELSGYIGSMVVLRGASILSSGVTYSVNSSTGCTVAVSASGVVSVSALTASTGTAVIRATVGSTTLDKTLTLTKSVDGVKGTDGVTVVLSNESHTLPADSSGNVTSYTGASSTVTVYLGITDDTANWTLSGVASSGVSFSKSGYTFTITSMTVDSGYVDITATKGSTTATKRFSLARAKAGSNGSPGSPGSPGTYVSFQYSKGTNSAPNTSSYPWSSSPYSLSTGEYAWMRAVTDGSPGTAYRTSGENGSNGTRGSITVYDSTNTSPSSSLATSAICTALGLSNSTSNLVRGDIVIFSKATSNQYYSWTGSTWGASMFYFDANVLVNGTLSATKLDANGISAAQIKTGTIDAARIAAGTITASMFSTTRVGGQLNMGTSSTNAITASSDSSGSYLIVQNTVSSSTADAVYASTSGTGAGGNFYGPSKGLVASSWTLGADISGTTTGVNAVGGYYGGKFSATQTTGGFAVIADVTASTSTAGRFTCSGNGNIVYLCKGGYAINTPVGGGKAYFQGGTGAFTGFHDGLLPKDQAFEIGDIVVDVDIAVKHDINSVLTTVSVSNTSSQKGVIGVISAARNLDDTLELPYDLWWFYEQTHRVLEVNALGEGQINVCGEGGNMEIGDLVVTSSIPGKGMRQADDIIRSYTVAKVRENVTFDSPDQVKQVACIYLCG